MWNTIGTKILLAQMYVKSVRVWNSTYEARSNFIKFAKTEIWNKKKPKFFQRIYVETKGLQGQLELAARYSVFP